MLAEDIDLANSPGITGAWDPWGAQHNLIGPLDWGHWAGQYCGNSFMLRLLSVLVPGKPVFHRWDWVGQACRNGWEVGILIWPASYATGVWPKIPSWLRVQEWPAPEILEQAVIIKSALWTEHVEQAGIAVVAWHWDCQVGQCLAKLYFCWAYWLGQISRNDWHPRFSSGPASSNWPLGSRLFSRPGVRWQLDTETVELASIEKPAFFQRILTGLSIQECLAPVIL